MSGELAAENARLESILERHWSYEPSLDYSNWLRECGAKILRGRVGDLDQAMRAHVADEVLRG